MSAHHFKIEKNIPVPSGLGNGVDRSREMSVLLKMGVGHSVFLAGINKSVGSGIRTRAAEKSGHFFTLRTVEGGVRIWRVS